MARRIGSLVHRPDLRAGLPASEPVVCPQIRLPIPLGDLVARAAQPIARFVDRIAGTQFGGCSACSRRHQYLNHLVPDIRSFSAWVTAWRRLGGPCPPAAQPRD